MAMVAVSLRLVRFRFGRGDHLLGLFRVMLGP